MAESEQKSTKVMEPARHRFETTLLLDDWRYMQDKKKATGRDMSEFLHEWIQADRLASGQLSATDVEEQGLEKQLRQVLDELSSLEDDKDFQLTRLRAGMLAKKIYPELNEDWRMIRTRAIDELRDPSEEYKEHREWFEGLGSDSSNRMVTLVEACRYGGKLKELRDKRRELEGKLNLLHEASKHQLPETQQLSSGES